MFECLSVRVFECSSVRRLASKKNVSTQTIRRQRHVVFQAVSQLVRNVRTTSPVEQSSVLASVVEKSQQPQVVIVPQKTMDAAMAANSGDAPGSQRYKPT